MHNIENTVLAQHGSDTIGLKHWLLTFTVCTIAVFLCVAYFDRPVADFMEARVRHTAVAFSLAKIFPVLLSVLVIAPAFLLLGGLWMRSGRTLVSWARAIFVCSCSVIATLCVVFVLKQAFGRTQPVLWTEHRVHGFHPLHGGNDYHAFPSGVASIGAAIIAVLWVQAPRLRIACMAVMAFISAVLIVDNFHFVADLIGGWFVGALMGTVTMKFCRSMLNARN